MFIFIGFAWSPVQFKCCNRMFVLTRVVSSHPWFNHNYLYFQHLGGLFHDHVGLSVLLFHFFSLKTMWISSFRIVGYICYLWESYYLFHGKYTIAPNAHTVLHSNNYNSEIRVYDKQTVPTAHYSSTLRSYCWRTWCLLFEGRMLRVRYIQSIQCPCI